MTTQRPPPNAALVRAARALRFALVLQGVVRWGALSAGCLLALLVLDNLLHLPQALRLPLAVVLAGGIIVEFYRKVLRLLLQKFTPAYAARWLEMHRGIGGNVLINGHQFAQGSARPEWSAFTAPVVDSSRSILDAIAPRSIWLTPRLKRWVGGLLVLAVAWTALGLLFPRYLTTGMERIFLPLADIPSVGSWDLTLQPTGRLTLVEGDKLDIAVQVKSALGFKAKPPVPELVWRDASAGIESALQAGEHASMLPTANAGEFAFSFSAVHQPFTFYVTADDSRSVSVQVDVLPLPEVKGSSFAVTPPTYTGLKEYNQPGPPASLDVPAGSKVAAKLELSADTPKVLWRAGTAATDPTDEMISAGQTWTIDRLVNESSAYELLAKLATGGEPRILAQGQITAVPDHPPEIDFITQDRNRAVNPGDKVEVEVKATDDYGVASMTLQIASGEDPTSARAIKTWAFVGPPGDKEPSPEKFTIELDPAVFTPGSTFLLTAVAADFSPAKQATTSRPIVLRVAGLQDLAVPQGDALEKLFDLLRTAIIQQTQANGQTDNLQLHLAEAVAANDVAKHLGAMNDGQMHAQDFGGQALDEAGRHDEGKLYVGRIEPLVHGEMNLALGQIGKMKDALSATPSDLGALQKRQVYILDSLIALLGEIASDRRQAAEALARKQVDAPPTVTAEQELAKLKDELKAFNDTQKKIIDATKQIRQLNPEDLTTEQQAMLGELAREESKQAAFFQEKLTDLSKLPVQDFGDGKIVSDMNEVYQEVQSAATALYQKRVEIAVPGEVAGLENAAKIEQNLERWLPSTPDAMKWSMEEPATSPDVAMAELPKELDDLVGDLLNKEQQMDPDKDDPSSSIMDSIDKGAGWGAADGPMSNMSAKGVTGNQLPNNDEIGGRSGEGRNGKSDGQMVGNTAVGKGGNETPTRMTPTPFENGSVNDTSGDTKGGATGGGKLAGYGQDGLRGPMAPPVQQKVRVFAEQQAKLRQQAESLALQLRKQRRPTGDLESAINAMKSSEDAARAQNGIAVVQGYHQALDSLQAARAAYAGDRLSRVEADQLNRNAGRDVIDSQAEVAPAGYEEMTGAYFRSLSESTAPADKASK